MRIFTEFNITVEIDNGVFEIKTKEASKEDDSKLKQIFDDQEETFSKRAKQEAELKANENEYAINEHILENGSVKEKATVWLEQKKLNREIFKQKDEISTLSKDSKSINELLEEVFEKRFDLLVSGDDKDKLKQVIEDKNVSYSVLFEAIASKIKEEKEKK